MCKNDTIKKLTIQPKNEKKFAYHISNKELVSEYIEYFQSNNKNDKYHNYKMGIKFVYTFLRIR